MIWIGLVTFFGIVAVVAAVVLPRLSYDEHLVRDGGPVRALGMRGAAIPLGLYAVFFVLFTLAASVAQVPAGHRGLVYEFGNITEVKAPGLTIKPPWAGIKMADVRVQRFRIDEDCANGQQDCIAAASIDSQNVYISGTLNFSIANCDGVEARKCEADDQAIVDLYRNVGPNYIEKVIVPRFKEVPKQRTIQYKAEEMLPKRAELAADIRDAFADSLAIDPRFSAIHVISFNVENIDFDQGFNDRIKAKVEAQQQRLVEQENVEIRKEQAQQAVEQARGEAQAQIEKAKGEAEANRVISESLSPEILQLRAIERLTDKLQIALLPANGSFLLDPTRLLQPVPASP